jgi:DNA-binding Lrp family transcriptional regulator
MTKTAEDMSENERKFLLALIADGSRTDADIADETGMSKSTANRIRRRFEENGTLREYIPVIDLEQIGVEVFATIILECDAPLETAEIAAIPNVIFLGETDDFTETYVIFGGFSGFDAYHEFLEDLKDRYRDRVDAFDSRVIPPQRIVKEDFTHLIKHDIKTTLQDET